MRCALLYVLLGLSLLAETPPTTPVKPIAKPPTPREVAWRLLSGVHLSIGKAQALVQPYLLLHLAENTVEFSPKLALTEFRDAFTDARILEVNYRAPLQAQIVTSVVPVDIPTAIEMVRSIRPDPAQRLARDNWDRSVETITAHLLGHSRADEGVELIKLVATPGIFPNQAASNMMNSLPASDDRRLGVFGYAATCYRQVPFPGFTTLLQDHWKTMPRALVVMAANAVADDGSHASKAELIQVLPILRELDPPRAERLLSEHPEIGDQAEPKPRKPASQESYDQRQAENASRLAAKYPVRALSMAQSIHDPDAREQVILQIATQALQSGGDPEVASRSLDMLLKLPARSQRDLSAQIAELAGYAGKSELAERFVETAFDIAARLLEADQDAKSECGVNPAPKDWWPSTAAYRAAVHASVTAFHMDAEHYLTRVEQNSDLYLLMSVEFARALLGSATTVTPKLSCAEAVAAIKEDAALQSR